MKWYDKIKASFKGSAKGAAENWKGKTWDFTNWLGRKFFGVDNSKLVTNETIFSIISRIANTVSVLPIKYYKNQQPTNGHVLDVLVNNPNQNMSGFEFINKMEVTRNETGNAYAVIIRDMRGQLESLLPIDSNYVTPFINSDDDTLWYQVEAADNTYYIYNMDMIHVKHITGASRWQGISPLDVLKNTLKYDQSVQEFSLSEMDKKDSFFLRYGANIELEKRKEVTEHFKKFYQENGGILLSEPGVDIEKMERRSSTLDILNSEKITRSRIANVFNVPVSFLNESEGQSYSSNEQLMIQFVQMTLTPIVRQYEHEFNRKLLNKDERQRGYYFKFSMGGLLRGDTAARTQFYQSGIRSGYLKPNEVRELEDLPPKTGGANELWLSGDLYPIDTPIEERNGGEKGVIEEEEESGTDDESDDKSNEESEEETE